MIYITLINYIDMGFRRNSTEFVFKPVWTDVKISNCVAMLTKACLFECVGILRLLNFISFGNPKAYSEIVH